MHLHMTSLSLHCQFYGDSHKHWICMPIYGDIWVYAGRAPNTYIFWQVVIYKRNVAGSVRTCIFIYLNLLLRTHSLFLYVDLRTLIVGMLSRVKAFPLGRASLAHW